MDNFITKVKEQLKKMSEEEKTQWILSQAKLTSSYSQDDFYKSLCGNKASMILPDQSEIEQFIQKVNDGGLVLLYETHYYEFDSEGHYYGDWDYQYNDPNDIMNYIQRIILGCHQLVMLEEYEQAYEILDQIIHLQFMIEDDPDTDDCCEEASFDFSSVIEERLLSIDEKNFLSDYIVSCHKTLLAEVAIRKIVDIITMQAFQYSLSIIETLSNEIINQLYNVLNGDLREVNQIIETKEKEGLGFFDLYDDNQKKVSIEKVIDYINVMRRHNEKKNSYLCNQWDDIQYLIEKLYCERFIDDQYELEEIDDIVNEVLQNENTREESWEIRSEILRDIYDHHFYKSLCIYESMEKLFEGLCYTDDEHLQKIEMMVSLDGGIVNDKTAKLFAQYGKFDKALAYYENNLYSRIEPYEFLMNYYKEIEFQKAVEYATLAKENCKDDLTLPYLILIEDALRREDTNEYKKLISSAKRRKCVDYLKIEQNLTGVK